jgi:hypothetical protein
MIAARGETPDASDASRNVAAFGAAGWLSLAAAPTFAIMALLTGVFERGAPDICSTHAASPLSGMVLMYLLMSAFHLAPWLKLLAASRRSGARRSRMQLPARKKIHAPL